MLRARRTSLATVAIVITAFLPTITSIAPAQATSACAPAYDTPDQLNGLVRNFIFTQVGTCTWTVPASMYVDSVLLIGAGGGGGGGSWAGASTGGGGGGGGSGGFTVVTTLPFIYRNSEVSITVGAGGSAGAGASAQSGSGVAGGSGETTKFGTWEAEGGLGGAGGGSDTGGAGGTSGKNNAGERKSGSSQSSGNGGAGGASLSGAPAESPSSGSAATGYSGAPIRTSTFINPIGYYFLPSGGGGANASSSATQGGTASASAATVPSNIGGGGHGGHGCAQSASTCLNRQGSAGSAGRVIVAVKWYAARNGDFIERTSVGAPFSRVVFDAPPAIGTGSWSAVDPPNGFSINTSTGEFSGTATSRLAMTFTPIKFTDSAFPQYPIGGVLQMNIGTGAQTMSIARQTLEIGKSFRIPIEQLKGTGSLTIFTSNANMCSLSGPNTYKETVTALVNSGTCTITVTKLSDSNYLGTTINFYIDLTKINSAVSVTTSAGSSTVSGNPITLTATTTSGATGNVQFFFGTTIIKECGGGTGLVAISNGQATCTWTPTVGDGGSTNLSAKYLGATNYSQAVSNVVATTILPNIDLAYPNSTTTYQSSIAITPTVSGGSGNISSWTWSVKRASDNSDVSGVSINSSGVITFNSSVPSGTYNMRARALDSAGVEKFANVSIIVAPTTPTVVMGAPTLINLTKGKTTTLSATLPSDASGTVTFKYGSNVITSCGTAGAVTVSSGSATCSWNTSSASSGTYETSAEYSGGGSYTSSNSNPTSITINEKAVITYANQSLTYGQDANLAPDIVAGTGNPSGWTWSVVRRSDSSTVSGISIDAVGNIDVATNTAAGIWDLNVTAVDLSNETSTATLQITVNKAQPILTLSPRLITNQIVDEATANRSISWKIQSTHPSSGTVAVFVDNSNINCSTSIQWSDGQCWWSSSNAGTTISAYATFAGDSNLETATSNLVSGFKINPSLSLSYSDTSTYSGIETTLQPTVSGGTGNRLFSITQYPLGDNVLGISIDSVTGVISVSKSAAPGVYRMQAYVYDLTNASAGDDNVQITVLAQQQPDFTISQNSETVEVDNQISGFSISNLSTPGFYYSISPALPAGLYFSPQTGEIFGRPTSAQSATTYTITSYNGAGSDTATFTLTVSEQLLATISVAIGTLPAAKGTANTIVATISHAGKVEFLIDGKRVAGCTPKRATTSLTCIWKPTRIGSVAISAKLFPNNNAIPSAVAPTINVGVSRRTGRR